MNETSKTSVIVYGPSGCGKSTNAERIREHFGLASIVDDFDPIRKGCSLAGVLYLTADPRSRKARAKSSLVKVRDYADVMAEIEKAVLPLTDWIPCTTPPVRKGVYERKIAGVVGPQYQHWNGEIWGVWDDTPVEAEMHAGNSSMYQGGMWRGVRRWVLVRENDPVMSWGGGKPTNAYIKQRAPRTTKLGALAQAIGFDTEAKALTYRDRGRHGIDDIFKAVLP